MRCFFYKVVTSLVCCAFFAACGSNNHNSNSGNLGTVASTVVTMADLQRVTKSNSNIMVDFYADWCGPCKQMEPAIANITRQYAGKMVVLRINVDQADELCKAMGIEAIPYIVFYKDGKIKNELEGYQREEVLKQIIETIFQ